MKDIEFGSDEHIKGLSRKALEEDFKWVCSRMLEMEAECERLDAENEKLNKVIAQIVSVIIRM